MRLTIQTVSGTGFRRTDSASSAFHPRRARLSSVWASGPGVPSSTPSRRSIVRNRTGAGGGVVSRTQLVAQFVQPLPPAGASVRVVEVTVRASKSAAISATFRVMAYEAEQPGSAAGHWAGHAHLPSVGPSAAVPVSGKCSLDFDPDALAQFISSRRPTPAPSAIRPSEKEGRAPRRVARAHEGRRPPPGAIAYLEKQLVAVRIAPVVSEHQIRNAAAVSPRHPRLPDAEAVMVKPPDPQPVVQDQGRARRKNSRYSAGSGMPGWGLQPSQLRRARPGVRYRREAEQLPLPFVAEPAAGEVNARHIRSSGRWPTPPRSRKDGRTSFVCVAIAPSGVEKRGRARLPISVLTFPCLFLNA